METSNFYNVVFSSLLEFWTVDEVLKPCDSDKLSSLIKSEPNYVLTFDGFLVKFS
jgi:hypothetical protein